MRMKNERPPLVSLCLLTYNQEQYVEEAVDGVLAQTYSPLEIIISDDGSTDATVARIRRRLAAHSADRRLVLNCNKVNLGLAEHVNVLTHHLARGDLIAFAAGDDISAPDRIARSVEFLAEHAEVMAVSTALMSIDATGQTIGTVGVQPEKHIIYGLDDFIANPTLHVNGPSRMFRREVAETFGPLHKDCPTEDSTYLLRCFLLGSVALLGEKLVKYRTHGQNMSAPHNIHRLSISRIKSQYLSDIATAEYELGLQKATKQAVLDRIEANMGIRLANSKRRRRLRHWWGSVGWRCSLTSSFGGLSERDKGGQS